MGKDVLVVTSTVGEANKLNNYLNKRVSSFAFQVEKKYSDTIDSTFELETQKVNIINEIINNKGNKVIVTDVFSYISYLPSKDSYKANILNLKVLDTINYHDLVSYCEEMGYDKSSIVNKTGDYGVRGYIFDVFIPTEDFPVRIEFFGDEITSIKYFDPRTQRTIKKIENISILPFTSNLKIEDSVNIPKYLDDYIVVYKDYSLIINENTKIVNEFKEDEKSFKFFDFNKIIEKEKIFYFDVENNGEKPSYEDKLNFTQLKQYAKL
jgi:transcription-repair coupling factor (superfamily II helicase)